MFTMMRLIRRSERGQTLVEFALVFPIFIFIFFGIIEVGRLWQTVNVLSSAAREGARKAAVTGPNVYQSTDAASRILNAANISGATISVSGPDAFNEVTVSVNIKYIPLTGSIIPGLESIPLSQSTTMRWEH